MKVILHFIHGGQREMYVSDEEFKNEAEPFFNELYKKSDWQAGCIQFQSSLIPIREIKFIEFVEPPELPDVSKN
ncbi:hypothetical protein P9C57_gp46 [Bacillus phage AP631]|uniref:Uncharacterized protein n=2 Tax=root TaxID=1 RepID=A0A3G8F2J7_9CAUD|nr:hypothetical protein P9C57_gp46 [Bacillus phage AP631]AZF88391.1 hypothetical protein AP631_0046 [Bacillus phage AP631]WPH60270.1 hypothetical protein [Bacillus phage vB_BanS-A16R1]